MTRQFTAFALAVLSAVSTLAAQDAAEAQKKLDELKAQVQAAEVALAKARQAEQTAAGSTVPADQTQFVIPKLDKAPVIDGVVDDAEWAGAISVPIAAGIFGMIERRSSTFYVGWDEENVYFAQRLPLRPGEKLLRLNREPKHDNVQPHENSVEVFLDLKGSGSHPSRCRWQFMGNAVGNQWDREDQFEIGQNFIGWDGQWQYKQRLTPDGKSWEAEIAIPRKTVYAAKPLADGDVWWIGLATDLHRPWCFSGFYQWRIPATFRAKTPIVRFENVQKCHTVRGLGGDFAITNPLGEPVELTVIAELAAKSGSASKVLLTKSYPLTIQPGKTEKLAIAAPAGDAVADEQSCTVSFRVMRGDRSLYTWAYPIAYNTPSVKEGLAFEMEPTPFVLQSYYNPLSNYVRVVVDKFDFPQADKVAKARAVIEPNAGGKPLANGEMDRFVYEKAQAVLDTPANLPAGTYACRAELLDKDGKVLATHKTTFEVKDLAKTFPWLNNKIGEDDIVVKPFEPLKVEGPTVHGYKKQIRMDASGLPAAIQAAGVDLLAGSMHLRGTIGENAFLWAGVEGQGEPKCTSSSATHADYAGSIPADKPMVQSTIHWEYDGTAKVSVTLAPGKADSLQLVIPFKPEAATHFFVNGLNMRLSNRAGALPAGKGVLWKSTEVPYQKMTVGSFIPIVWVGNMNSGLTWFADSDEGWFPSDKAPAIEIVRRDDGIVELVLNLASAPAQWDKPRTIEFGLNVNPVRPYSEHKGSVNTFGYLRETGRWDPQVTKSKVFARRYPDNVERSKRYGEVAHKYNEINAPYTEMSKADFFTDEADYFWEEWRSQDEGGPVLHCESSNDCLLYWTKRWIDDAGLDGYYFDNVFCRMNWNTHAGTAYELPDGRVQPGYSLWAMRSQIKRIRTVLQVSGRDPSRICIHNTRFQFAPIMGFADLAMGGEMATPRGDNPGAGDFMDMYPRDFMDVMYNQPLWGYKLSHLYHYRPETFVDAAGEFDEATAMKVHRSAMATMLVHGVEFFGGIRYQPFLAAKWQLLKKWPGGMPKFLPSWQAKGLFEVKSDPTKIDAAIYYKDDMLLVIVANYDSHAQRARVWVDFPKLLGMPGKMEDRVIWDFETLAYQQGLVIEPIPESGEKLPRIGDPASGHPTMHQPNTVMVTVQPHNFRAILFANVPFSKGTGF